MSKFIKRYWLALVLVGIQIYFFYQRIGDGYTNHELYFFGWGIAWFAMFFYSIRADSNMSSGIGMGGNHNNIGAYVMTNKTELNSHRSQHEKDRSKFRDMLNIYLGMCIINIIGYIINVIIIY